MKRLAWSRVAKLLTAIAFAIAAGTWTVRQLGEQEVARRDQQEVARMTKEMETVCLGRFLIDMPSEAQIGLRGVRVDGLEIESFEESAADFLTRLALREKRLKGEPKQLVGTEYLESVTEVNADNGVVGKIFVHGRTLEEGTRMSGTELERYRYEGVVVEAMVHGGGMSFEIGAKDYSPNSTENLPKLIAKLVPNRANHVPAGPGFCFDGGWFRDPLNAGHGERLIMHAGFSHHPDIDLTLILAAGNKPDEQSLLQRSADVDARRSPAEKWRLSNLRAAPRTIGGIAGDEIVTRSVEFNDAIVYGFWWEVNGTEDDVLIPHFSFTMETGKSNNGPVPSSLSQDAALALWDKISSSIRLHHPRPPRT
jgi:hypothetical protein